MNTSELAKPKSEIDISVVVLLALFATSLCLNVWLGHKVRSSSNFTRYIETTVGGKPAFSNLRDIDGKPFTFTPNNKRVLYFFSPTCKWCERNLNSFQSLNQQISSQYSFVGIVSDNIGVKEYLRVHPLPFPTVVVDNPSDVSALGLHGTPQTIVLQNGTVTHNWPGAYMGETRDAIQKEMHVSLPKLAIPQ